MPERVLIILDEAYFEYAKDNPRYPDSMHYRYDNVITLRTFSKIYGLAGIRIGYGFAHEDLIAQSAEGEAAVRAQHAGAGGGDRRVGGQGISAPFARAERARLAAADRFVPGDGPDGGASDANFVMLPLASAGEAARVDRRAAAGGVIVRPLGAFGLPHCIRISTGTDEENAPLRRSVLEERHYAKHWSRTAQVKRRRTFCR